MDKELEEFLLHYGVKGMKWGVRKDLRAKKRSERRDRFSSGKATLKDKLISDLDFDRSAKERRQKIKPPTPARGHRISELNNLEKTLLGATFVASLLYAGSSVVEYIKTP